MALLNTFFIVGIFLTIHVFAASPSITSCDQPSSCSNTTIDCSSNTDCTILCNATSSCADLTINSPIDHTLTIQCLANNSCSNLQINAKYASSLHLKGCPHLSSNT